MFNIRPFERPDQKDARRLILSGLGEHFGYINISLNEDLDDIWEHYIVQGHLFFVAVADEHIVATGGLLIREGRIGQIVRVTVDPAYRQQGLGIAMVNHLINQGRTAGLQQFSVETNNDWLAAIRLYEKCGFEETGRDDVAIYMSLNSLN